MGSASGKSTELSAFSEPLGLTLDGWVKTRMGDKRPGLTLQFCLNSNKDDIVL